MRRNRLAKIVATLGPETGSAEAMRSLRLLTGEDVGAAMATLLENAPGNKVDALQVAGSTTAATTADSTYSTTATSISHLLHHLTTLLPPSLPMQTMLRAIVRLYRNAFVELIGDARAATPPAARSSHGRCCTRTRPA